MATKLSFKPDWVSPPGDTIADILEKNNLSLGEFGKQMGCSAKYINKLLTGRESISLEIAKSLELTLGGSTDFWIKRDLQYREDLARLRNETRDRKEWLKKLPLRDMTKYRWITTSSNTINKERVCLDFFGVDSVKEWYEKYNDLHLETSFRTSSSFDSQPESVITWLRQGKIESEDIKCKPWNATRFAETLLQVRPLTRIKNPQSFIPKLQKYFAQCGVSLAIVPTPSKCHASGGTYFLSPNKALLLLSFRHLSDDHFWFSLFHEAGHILLHGNTSLFLEGVDKCSTQEEVEANNFAAEILIPPNFQTELRTLTARNWRQIIRFAKNVGVSPGIVVGQLQHLGVIRHDQLNKLKTRFKWTTNVAEALN